VRELSGSFARAWGRAGLPKPGLGERLKVLLKRNPQLRLKVMRTIRALEKDIRRLNAALAKFEAMEKEYEAKAKEALRAGRENLAKALANSIATIRDYTKIILFMKICFEGICARLKLVFEMGNIMVDLTPLRDIVKIVGPVVAKFMPQVEGSLGMVRDVLDTLVSEMEDISNTITPVELQNEDASKILEALSISIEREADQVLPDIEVELQDAVGHREKIRGRGGLP